MPVRLLNSFTASSALVLVLLGAGCGAESPQQMVAHGKAELAKGVPGAAVIHFKSALQADPGALDVRILLGQALLQSGDAAGAVVELSRALEQKAKPDDVLPSLASAMLFSGQAKKLTADHGNRQLEDKQAQAEFQTQMAAAWTVVGNNAKADKALELALAAVPDMPRAKTQQARILIARGESRRALDTLQAVFAKDAATPEAWFLKAEALAMTQAPPAEVEALLRKAIELDPQYVSAHASLAVLKLRQKDFVAAKKQYEALRGFAPGSSETIFIGAQLAWYDKDYRKARDGVQLLLRGSPDDTRLLQFAAAVEWQDGGSLVIAQKHLETAVRLEPQLDSARANLAQIYLRLGQTAKALEVVQPVVKGERALPLALSAAGEAALQLGDPASAEKYFERAAAAAPGDARPQTSVALAQIARGDDRAGFSRLESLVSQSGDGYADAALVSARLKRNELREALRAVDGMLAKNPKSASAHEMRGRVLVSLRETKAARGAFQKAIELEPRGLVSMLGLADLELMDGRPEETRRIISDYLKANPGNQVAVAALANIRIRAGEPVKDILASVERAAKEAPGEVAPRLKLIELLTNQRQTKAAVAAAQEASAFFADDVQVLDAYGRALMAAGNHEQALTAFRRITSIDPNLPVAHLRLAEAHKAMGNLSAQVASLRRAVEIDPRQAVARANLVNLLVDARRTKEALEIAKDLQAREPTSAAGYLLEGAVHRKLRDNDASAAAYRKGLQRATDPADLPMNLVISLLAADKFKAAEAFALEWLSKQPTDGAVVYNLAEGYLMQKDYPNAERFFARAISLRPDHPPSLNNLAWLLLIQGKPGALEPARQASRLMPNHPDILNTLSMAQAAEKQLPEALESLKRAVELAPRKTDLRMNLAKLAIQAGDKGLARQELERVIAEGDKGGFKAAASQLLATL
jgi:cellulose synthase operon protein C